MELRQLRYFVSAVETGSITAAAKVCHVAQPSLSQQIRSLEEELGETLLHRLARGVTPTASGKRVFDHACRVLAASTDLTNEFETESTELSGSISLGIIPTIAPYLIPPLLTELRTDFPNIDLDISEDQTAQLIRRVAEDEIEFAIVSDISPADKTLWSLEIRELFHEPLVLAAPEQHPLARQRAKPRPEELVPEELIYLKNGHCLLDQTLRACRMKHPSQRLNCDQLETALAMVAAGMGLAIIPKLATTRPRPDGIVIRSFADPAPTRVVSLMRRRSRKPSPRAEALVQCLQQIGR